MTTELMTFTPQPLANGKTKRTFGFAHYREVAKAQGIKGKKEIQEFASQAMRAQTQTGLEAANKAVELGFSVTKADAKTTPLGDTMTMTFFRPATGSKDSLAIAEAKLAKALAEVEKIKAMKALTA